MSQRPKEILTSCIPIAGLIAFWISGFWFKGIHAGMSIIFILVVGGFPIWIAFYSTEPREEPECGKESSGGCLGGDGEGSLLNKNSSRHTVKR